MPKAAVCGAMNADLIGTPRSLFRPGDSIPGTVTVRAGGVGRNIAEALIRLGCSVSMYTALGEDDRSAILRASAERIGLDLSGSETLAGERCGTYLCVNDSEGNVAAAISDMEICSRMTPEFYAPHIAEINRADFAVIDGNLPGETIRYLTERITVPVFADCVSVEKAVRFRGALNGLCAIKPNLPEAEALTGETGAENAADALLAAGVGHVFITLGSHGVYAAGADGRALLPCVPGEIRSTNGCGDVFLAAAAVRIMCGGDTPKAAGYALAAAALNAQSDEAVNPLLSARAVEKLVYNVK